MTDTKRRKFWGWGLEGEGPQEQDVLALGDRLRDKFGISPETPAAPPRLSDLDLRAPRLSPPASLEHLFSQDPHDRAEHTFGKSMRDFVLGMEGRYDNPPDLVAFPRNEEDIQQILEYCAEVDAAIIPYGGGSSVADGIDPGGVGEDYAGVVTVDLRHLDQVLDLDLDSRSALIQAGALGPAIEDQLRPHGVSMRFYLQSFEFSSLGGWIATRAAGHFANLHTQIDDQVQALRTVTPKGTLETRRLPADGAGTSADRLLIGSEGTLGIITQAWMRLHDRPVHRASASVQFRDFSAAWSAARVLAKSGLWPSNLRLLDPTEAKLSGSGDGSQSILIIAFESAYTEVQSNLQIALELIADYGGVRQQEDDVATAHRQGDAGKWRDFFVKGPYLKEAYTRMGVIRETFETSCTWRDWPEFHAGVVAATQEEVRKQCGVGEVACRLTHVYPDGPAPYYTVIAQGKRGAELEQWAAIKEAASAAVLKYGGTITHHHAVGRYHRPWYDQQRPELFADALGAAKTALDPQGLMNPGVLIDPTRNRG